MSPGDINPTIPGFAPDSSIILFDDTFFLVNSTSHLFPGLPIYASKDLVSWEQIGNAINRKDQLNLARSKTKLSPPDAAGEVMLVTGGLYAPTLRHHNGKFYVIYLWSDKWSDPTYFNFHGIDPSIFWDDDDGVYIHGSTSPGPMTKIKLFEIDFLTGKKLSAEKTIWDGTGGIYPEGPHIYKKDGWFYPLISEGGTHDGHMITVVRSGDIWGPYDSFKGNPTLTARGTHEYIQYTGHCDVFEDRFGDWWGVCLGVRKTQSRYVIDRETFLTHGSCDQGEWPKLDRVVSNPVRMSEALGQEKPRLTSKPMVDLVYIRDADLGKHEISNNGEKITLTW